MFRRRTAALFGKPPTPLPAGGLGYWVMSDYQPAKQVVPNRLSVAAVSANILRYSRRQFSSALCLGVQIGVTIVDNVAAAPDGSIQASSLTGVGDWSAYARGSAIAVPNGVYTVACSVKRNTGTDQLFELGDFITNTYAVCTATSAWQRFSFTFTASAGIDPRIKSHLLANASLLICDFEAYAGASDLGPQTFGGHLYLGRDAASVLPDTSHAVSGSYIDFSGVDTSANPFSVATINFDGLTSSSTVTFLALIRQTVTGALFPVNFLISDPGTPTKLALSYAQPCIFYFAGAVIHVEVGGVEGLTTHLVGQGWKVLGCCSTATQAEMLINNSVFSNYTWTDLGTPPSSIIFDDFRIGCQFYAGPFRGQIAAMALWPRALSKAEQQTAVNRMAADVAVKGVAISPSRLYIPEGDSITIGIDTTNGGFPEQYGIHATPAKAVFGHNYAVGGNRLADFVARASHLDTAIPAAADGGKYFLTLLSINDLPSYADYGGSRAAYLTALAAYLDARRAAGFTVLLCTQTSVSGVGSAVNAERAILTPIFRTWPGLHCDAIVDFAADPVMGPDAASSDTTLYTGGAHPTDLGVTHLWPILKAVIETF